MARTSSLSKSESPARSRSEEHTSELQSPCNLVCRLLLEKKKQHNVYRSLVIKFPFRHSNTFHTPLARARLSLRTPYFRLLVVCPVTAYIPSSRALSLVTL